MKTKDFKKMVEEFGECCFSGFYDHSSVDAIVTEFKKAKKRKKYPDWNDAPDWANWCAVDSDGEVFWYDIKPAEGRYAWFPEQIGDKFGKYKKNMKQHEWKKMIWRRPEK